MKIVDETRLESCQSLLMPASKKFMPLAQDNGLDMVRAQETVFNLHDIFNATQNLWMCTYQPFCEEWP